MVPIETGEGKEAVLLSHPVHPPLASIEEVNEK